MTQTVHYPVPLHEPQTPSSSRNHSQHHTYPPQPTPTLHPASHSRALEQFQPAEEVRSRWVALQALAVTWPPGTIEPLDSTGESPLMAFVDRSERKYCCRVPIEGGVCDKENIKKGRMLAHIRKEHLQFRPFACGGHCGLIGWLAGSPPV